MKNFMLVALCFSVLFTVCKINLNAQIAENRLTSVALTAEGIVFLAEDADGSLELISEPLLDFAVESLEGNAEWLILSEKSFAVSPDGQQIAFTAHGNSEDTLFLFNLNNGQFVQHEISSYWLLPHWSPDSQSILLSVGLPYWGDLPLPHDYVYVLESATLFQITFTEDKETAFHWSQDGDNLLYFGGCGMQDCEDTTPNIYYVSRDGTTRFPITNFQDEIDPHLDLNVCHFEWNPSNLRWYYVIGCGGSFDNRVTYVYSTDLSGDNQLEFDVEAYFHSTEGLDADLYLALVRAIHRGADGIYFSMELSFFPDPDMHPDLGGQMISKWRVVRLTDADQLEILYQNNTMLIDGSAVELSDSLLSPDEQKMVLLFYDKGLVIDLLNGENIVALPGLSDDDNHAVCDVRWLDNDTLVYNVGGRHCTDVNQIQSKEIWALDVVSGEVNSVSGIIADFVWLLPG